jgi:ABC-type dipeptide/oligopeptide/nickel transport system permease subunit
MAAPVSDEETSTGQDSMGDRETPLTLALRKLRRDRLALVSLFIIGTFAFVAIAAPVIAPYSPEETILADRLQGPSGAHLFGTDQFGRDILSRVIFGTRVSFLVGIISVSIGMFFGIPLGAIAAWNRGSIVDEIIMRSMDVILSFPVVVLAIALVGVLGTQPVDLGFITIPNIGKVMIVIGFITIPQFARTVRGDLLSELEEEYVEASIAVGESWSYVLFRDALVNVISSLLVLASLRSATAILTEALLSFLGIGVQPPRPSWGLMLSNARDYMISGEWWMAVFPGLMIFFLVIALNMLGDSLRDAADPRLE